MYMKQRAGRGTSPSSLFINPLITLTESEFWIHEHQKSQSRNSSIGELRSPSGEMGRPRTPAWDRRAVECRLVAPLTEEPRRGNAVSTVKKGHAKCIPRQMYVKGRLWHTSSSFLMKTLEKWTILFLAFLRSAQQCLRVMAMEKRSLYSALRSSWQLDGALEHI